MTNTTAQLAAARIRQALEAFELAMGASQGIPAREVLIRACSPDSLRALLAERDELAKDAARLRVLAKEMLRILDDPMTSTDDVLDYLDDADNFRAALTNKD